MSVPPRDDVRPLYRLTEAEAAVHALYDEARAALPFPTDERFVETCLGRTHLLVAGQDAAGVRAIAAHLEPFLVGGTR